VTGTATTPAATLELEVFTRLLRAHASLRRRLEARLLAEHRLTINDYETLLHLAREPVGRLRRVDLAQRLLLTPSGVTRLLDGLEAAGHVCKRPCADDLRVSYAELTRTGRACLDEAAAAHVTAVRELVGERLDPDELAALSSLLSRLPGAGDATGEHCLPACDR
jgi:DNA-binding MarR family transcriptional regulator